MLALPAGPGDFALRTDLNKTYVLRAAPATTLANWAEFLSPGAPVRSVQGRIGDVVISNDDVGAAAEGPKPGRRRPGEGRRRPERRSRLHGRHCDCSGGPGRRRSTTRPSRRRRSPSLLAALGGKVGTARRVDTAGLAPGRRRPFDADRTITVPKASAADVEGMADDTRAVTAAALAGTLRSIQPNGYLRIPGTPLIIQWGNSIMPAQNVGTHEVRNLPDRVPQRLFSGSIYLDVQPR
jgi:hypothetical protein